MKCAEYEVSPDNDTMSQFDDILKQLRELEKSHNKLGLKVAGIKGQLEAPKKAFHPVWNVVIGLGCTATLAFWTWVGVTIIQDGRNLAKVQQSLTAFGVTFAAKNPTNPKDQKEAIAAIAKAKEDSIPIPTKVVNLAGRSFDDAAISDTGAFKVAVEFATYRTSLNADNLGFGWVELTAAKNPKILEYEAKYRVSSATRPRFFSRGIAVLDDAAQFLPLGRTDPRIGLANKADRDLRIEDGEFRLDDTYLKNVWFVNSTIHYAGRPFRLDHVIFINCTFVLENGPNTRTFVGSILADEPSLSLTIN